MPLTPGVRLGRYEIRQQVGAGGMAEVYLAEDTQLGRRVALKLLPPDTSSDDHARKRLLREARAAATLDHPHICAVYDVAEADGHRFIAMQYIEGDSLDVRLRKESLSLREVLAFSCDIADALAAAHAQGIVHRDVKPSNVMITTRGEAVVLDFGLAKLFRDDENVQSDAATESLVSKPGVVLGTIPYMSPEQVRGEPLDGRSDIFSFGVLIYEMVSGQRPFADKSSAAIASAILTRDPAPLARFQPELPAELERIVAKTLRKDPNDRYQTARDLLTDLRTLRDDEEFHRRLGRSGPRSSDSAVPPSEARAPSAVKAVTTGIDLPQPARRRSRLGLAIAGTLLVAAAGTGWWLWRSANVRWARAQLPKVEALAAERRYFEAYDLAANAQRNLPADPTLARLLGTVAIVVTVKSAPAGASVYLKAFNPDASGVVPPRRLVGVTPLVDFRIARGEYVLSIEKDGYAPIERTVSGIVARSGTLVIAPPAVVVDQALIALDKMPARMVFVPGGNYRLVAWSRPTDARVRLDNYFIDKYEVTNREYKEFIDAGGYVKKDFWKAPMIRNGRPLSWEEAMAFLKDRTGLPGPRSWSGQAVPDGRADHPVTDISWYEAAAYAAFRGKQLPSVFQWEKAARNGAVSALVNYMPWGAFYPGDTLAHHANFENRGPVPVMSLEFGMSPFGAYNMAGNVSEWTGNETSEGFLATGGAWGDPTYTFAQYPNLPALYSSSKVGFRCALNSPEAKGHQGMARIEIKEEVPSYRASSAAEFKGWLARYEYAKTPLDPRVENVTETPEWRREKITFNGADGERATAYLYLPRHVPRPVQVVHFVPGGDVASGRRSLPDSMEDRLGAFIKSGRAAFGVNLKGYSGRLLPEGTVPADPTTVEYLERIVNRITDLRRGLDYLETRDDLDRSRIAFFGPSAGAYLGLILAATESRYRTVVLMGAGVSKADAGVIPAASPVNFAPHIRPPKLMVHGRYDEDTPLKTQAEPLYALLPQPKRLILFEGGHVPPLDVMFSTISTWLDETLGRVKAG
ncbi:MAG TPA: SUMF1/EgtB/PvdO family nonheme iron enzyme [Vicinamibacterales bacterium]|nr:SUMF1/EgtB/PvdO family nonheme iron enzyme [Vicinamibacterales bacterium]